MVPSPHVGPDARFERLRRFERRTAVPMLVLSLVFIVVVVLPFAVTLTSRQAVALDRVAYAIWAVYVVEFITRLVLAPDRVRFLGRNVLDLVAVALPMLRPLRLVRSIGLLRLVGVVRVETSIARLLRRGRRQFGRHRIIYSSLVIALITLGAATVTFVAEGNATGGNLHTFGGTLWWAVQIVTTVGAADSYPVTAMGRIAAVVLMVVGIGLFGLVAASLASRYVLRGDAEGTQSRSEERIDPRTFAEQLDRIEGELRTLRSSTSCSLSTPAPQAEPQSDREGRAA